MLLERLVDHDPAVQPNQPVFVKSEVFAPGKPLPTVGGFWDRLWQHVQSSFDLDQNSGNHAAEMAKGAWETTTGLASMLWGFSQARKIVDPDGWQRQVEDTARGVIHAVQNPLEALKAITDWDTWVTNPERAFGRLLPDILAAAVSGGASSAASGAGKAVTAVKRINEILKTAKARAGKGAAPPRLGPDGTWEWKNLKLTPEQNRLADEALARARRVETRISSGVQTVARELGAEMTGFPEHVLKGSDRYKEKLAEHIKDNPNRPVEDIIRDDMHDGIRYTFTFSEDRYTKGVTDAVAALKRQGFVLVKQAPSWNNPTGYKGVNTRWRGPDGHLFEVQFHTPSSSWAKEVTHDVYEYKHHLDAEDADLLEQYEDDVFEAVPTPPGATEIPKIEAGK